MIDTIDNSFLKKLWEMQKCWSPHCDIVLWYVFCQLTTAWTTVNDVTWLNFQRVQTKSWKIMTSPHRGKKLWTCGTMNLCTCIGKGLTIGMNYSNFMPMGWTHSAKMRCLKKTVRPLTHYWQRYSQCQEKQNHNTFFFMPTFSVHQKKEKKVCFYFKISMAIIMLP